MNPGHPSIRYERTTTVPRKDKLLDILALAEYPEHVKLAKLARRWIGKPFPRAQALSVVKCYLDTNGRTPEVVQALIDEKNRQERIRNERQAFKDAAVEAAKSPLEKYRQNPQLHASRTMAIIQKTFGQHVRDNFDENALAMMSLIQGEDRWYEIRWLDAGFRPVRSALIEVVTMSPSKGLQYNRFLLYKVNGRVLVARTPGRTVRDGFGSQLPVLFLNAVEALKQQGYTFKSDLEDQSMIVFDTHGAEYRRVPWEGRTVDD